MTPEHDPFRCEKCGERTVGTVHYEKLPNRVIDTMSFRCYTCDAASLKDDRGRACKGRACRHHDANTLGIGYHYVLKTVLCCGVLHPVDVGCFTCGRKTPLRRRGGGSGNKLSRAG